MVLQKCNHFMKIHLLVAGSSAAVTRLDGLDPIVIVDFCILTHILVNLCKMLNFNQKSVLFTLGVMVTLA